MNAKLITEYIALKKYLIARITSLMTAFSSSFQYLQKKTLFKNKFFTLSLTRIILT